VSPLNAPRTNTPITSTGLCPIDNTSKEAKPNAKNSCTKGMQNPVSHSGKELLDSFFSVIFIAFLIIF
jgi:hypothetical protein